MPFAEMPRCITPAFEQFGERGFFEWQVFGPLRSKEFFIGGVYSGDKGSEMEAGRGAAAYALVNLIPCLARRSMFGVW